MIFGLLGADSTIFLFFSWRRYLTYLVFDVCTYREDSDVWE